jgi:hypothetical protein
MAATSASTVRKPSSVIRTSFRPAFLLIHDPAFPSIRFDRQSDIGRHTTYIPRMSKPEDIGEIRRIFRDISSEVIGKADDIAILESLGYRSKLDWPELLKSSRILIMASAGAGKTHECQLQRKCLWDAGEPAFYVELAELARTALDDILGPEELDRLGRWHRAQSDTATFFLDSYDELKLTRGSFRTALTRLAHALSGRLARSRIVITTRPIPFDEQIVRELLPVPPAIESVPSEIAFADIAMNKGHERSSQHDAGAWRSVVLTQLSDSQIVEFAGLQGVSDSKALFADLKRRDALDFARRPQDLIEISSTWREGRRVATHRDQVATDIKVKLKPRTDREELADLSPQRAFEGASRLALAALLMRALTIRHSAEADRGGEDDTAIDPEAILFDWSQEECKTLLERALFGFASYGRVRFHHRSVIEFLAAARLQAYLERGVSVKAVKRLLLTKDAPGEGVVKPSVASMAAWLALSSEPLFNEIVARSPQLMLTEGDPGSLTSAQKAIALEHYVSRYGHGGWRGLSTPYVQVHRFADSSLAPTILRLWPDVENEEVRDLLLSIAAAGRISACADLAFGVVTAPTTSQNERLSALEILARVNDLRLPEVIHAIETDAKLWPECTAKAALIQLFPESIGIPAVLATLRRVREAKSSISYLNYHLPRLIPEAALDDADVDRLRDGIGEIIRSGAKWSKEWPHFQIERSDLMPALAALSHRQVIAGDCSPGLADAIAIVLRFAKQEGGLDEPIQQLSKAVCDATPSLRAQVFWAADALTEALHPARDVRTRAGNAGRRDHFSVNGNDAGWILDHLGDRERPLAERLVALELAVSSARPNDVEPARWEARLRTATADETTLFGLLEERLAPRELDEDYLKHEVEWAERKAANARQEAEDHLSWVAFWREIAERPEELFGEGRERKTVWNLWHAMQHSGDEGRPSGWRRHFIERYFSPDVADRMRIALGRVWRSDRPTLRNERDPEHRNTYSSRWLLGLAGVGAEAEDPRWAQKLSPADARLACRYVPLELDGFPGWLDNLAAAHPDAIIEVLGGELRYDLGQSGEDPSDGWLLQSIDGASETVARLFVPQVRAWLDEHGDRAGHNENSVASFNRLNRVVGILLSTKDPEIVAHIRQMAIQRVGDGLQAPFAGIWLPTLMRLDPPTGVSALEQALALPDLPPSEAVGWFANLFGRDHHGPTVDVGAEGFTPSLLLRLARLAHKHVAEADDLRHEGVYSPGPRDDAQRARGVMLNALIDAKGEDAWRAKLELADDPLLQHMRDRIHFLSRERAAAEAEGTPMTADQVVMLERRGETPPMTREAMFDLMIDRLDDIDDMLVQDVSPRAAWALIENEKVMRRMIALHLKTHANGAYTVDQEGVTDEEKETDIRLRSVAADQQGVIELKVGDKDRSAADLRDTLSSQVVTKYLAPEGSRVGCLAITRAKRQGWRHPETNASLTFAELIDFLSAAADELEAKLAGAVRLHVRGIDLEPRLLVEREQRKKGKIAAAARPEAGDQA